MPDAANSMSHLSQFTYLARLQIQISGSQHLVVSLPIRANYTWRVTWRVYEAIRLD